MGDDACLGVGGLRWNHEFGDCGRCRGEPAAAVLARLAAPCPHPAGAERSHNLFTALAPSHAHACTVEHPLTAGAENSYNLFTVRRNADAASDEDRARLEVRLPVPPRPNARPRAAVACGPPGDGCRESGSSGGGIPGTPAPHDGMQTLPTALRLSRRRWGGTTWASLSTASSTAPWSCACQTRVRAAAKGRQHRPWHGRGRCLQGPRRAPARLLCAPPPPPPPPPPSSCC